MVFVAHLAQSTGPQGRPKRTLLAVGTPASRCPPSAIVAVGGELAAVVTPVASQRPRSSITPMAGLGRSRRGRRSFMVAYDYAA